VASWLLLTTGLRAKQNKISWRSRGHWRRKTGAAAQGQIFNAWNLIGCFTRRIDRRSILQMKRPPAELRMRGYTTKEKLKITAGAVAALVIVGWAVVLAVIFLSVR
jgi:hypothetical protein